MPKLTRAEIKERERFVIETWKKVWPKGSDSPGANVSVAKVNAMVNQKFGENMRTDKMYRLRDQAIAELRAAGTQVPDPTRKNRKGASPRPRPAAPAAPPITQAGRKAAPRKAEGETTSLPQILKVGGMSAPEAVAYVLNTLRGGNHINVQVEHAGPDYVVVNLAP